MNESSRPTQPRPPRRNPGRTPSSPRASSASRGASAVVAGAERATGERARRRRRTTPLLDDLEPFPAPSKAAVPEPEPATATASVTPVVTPLVTPPVTRGRRRRPAARRTSGGERLVAVADLAAQAGEQIAEALEELESQRRARAEGSGAADGRDGGQVRAESAESRIAEILAFLRRRLTGDFQVDEYGFDPELTETVTLHLLRVLYQRWFRVEVRGIDNVPSTGGALIVANHAGAIALDSLMVQVALHDEHPEHRFLRPLGADLVFSSPIIGELARKGGATLANNADAERLLAAGEVVGVWPEGFKGIGKPFSERYKLQRFGRGGFVSAALRTGAPIVPCAIVGSEETYPILGNIPTLARLLGLPYFPITPTFPLLGPLGLIPLPSKWLIEFGSPVPTGGLGPGAADDPMLVFDLTDQVRQTIQQTLYQLLVQRQSPFF